MRTLAIVALLLHATGCNRASNEVVAWKNGVKVASSNGEVKRLVESGQVAFGLTDTEDASEALHDGAPVAVVYPDQDGIGTLVMPTTVVLLKGAPSSRGSSPAALTTPRTAWRAPSVRRSHTGTRSRTRAGSTAGH